MSTHVELPADLRVRLLSQYRRIAIDCANAVLLGQDATVAPPAEAEDVDAAIYNYCAKANANELHSQGATWTSVSSGEDPVREAAHWKEVAEQGFRESARLRAMVQALRSTFDEVEQENEELHVAYAMQQREILTLGHHLEFKSLEQETLIANFERAMAEMDDTMEDICLEALQADAAAYARDVAVVGEERARHGLRHSFHNFHVQRRLRLGCRAPGAVIRVFLCRAERRDRHVPRCRGRRHVHPQRRHVHQGGLRHAEELGLQ